MTTPPSPSRTLLITGCSSGIGLDAARHMRARGWRVFAACRQQQDCDRLQREGFDSPRIDHEDPDSIDSGLAEVLAATGGTLDALFNNGAYALPGLIEDIPRAGLEAQFSANFFGVHQLTRAAIPALRASGRGRIVNCSSVLGILGYAWRGPYVATKFALEGYTDVLRLEMRDQGIKVVLIQPGPIATPFRSKAIPHFERWVDWRASHRAADYEANWDALYGRRNGAAPPTDADGNPKPDGPFTLPAAAVSRVLARALQDRTPRARYRVTTPTRIAEAMRRALPDRLRDRLLAGRA